MSSLKPFLESRKDHLHIDGFAFTDRGDGDSSFTPGTKRDSNIVSHSTYELLSFFLKSPEHHQPIDQFAFKVKKDE